MPSSSLIFVLVVAIWAAYLLQHWIRRRDHLSTARSVDRFSEAMRVLERRKPLPESPLATPEPRSYAVGPARPPRAEVTVKRAAPKSDTAPRAGRLARLRSGMTGRRLRGVTLLLCFLLVIASVALVVLGRLQWWAIPAASGLLVLDLVWLRHASRRRRARRRDAARERAVRTARPARERRTVGASPRPDSSRRPVAGGWGAIGPRSVTGQEVDSVYDADAALAMAVERRPDASTEGPDEAAAGPSAPTRPGEWQPVPVPPPTYTLKAKAERPATAPAESEPVVEPEPVVAAEPFDHSAPTADEPTAAVGDAPAQPAEAPYGRDLPFDGLALDEELEELPPAYAVG